MARSIIWPQVAPPAEARPSQPAAGLDLAGLAAAFGPDLARRMGLRATAAALAEPLLSEEPAVGLARIPLAVGNDGLAALGIGCAPAVGALLLERLFGAPTGHGASGDGADLLALPPGSASWAALCRTLASALVTALAATGRATAGSPALPARALPLAPGPRSGFRMDLDGTACTLWILAEAEQPAEPAPQAPDAMAFRAAARARAFEMELPVALRIAERRIRLAEAGALSVGDIIPIDPLPMPEVLAGGRRIARLPASAFRPPVKPEEGQ